MKKLSIITLLSIISMLTANYLYSGFNCSGFGFRIDSFLSAQCSDLLMGPYLSSKDRRDPAPQVSPAVAAAA